MNQKKSDTHNYLCAYADELRKEGLSNEELFPCIHATPLTRSFYRRFYEYQHTFTADS